MKRVVITINVVLLLGLSSFSAYLFFENRDLKNQSTLTTEEKNKQLVEEINKVYDLPEEDPVVAVVTDVEEFKKQYSVFDNAESGDYLLFYRKARLNVLYRQSEKKVIKTADVLVPITVEVIGSQESIDSAVDKLSEFGNQITVTKTVKPDITQSFVFDLDNDQESEAKSIADLLKLDIGSTVPSSITPGEQTEIIITVADEAPSTQTP